MRALPRSSMPPYVHDHQNDRAEHDHRTGSLRAHRPGRGLGNGTSMAGRGLGKGTTSGTCTLHWNSASIGIIKPIVTQALWSLNVAATIRSQSHAAGSPHTLAMSIHFHIRTDSLLPSGIGTRAYRSRTCTH